MSITNRLYFIFGLFIILFFVSIFGILQVSKGADFHKFNVLHHYGSLNMYLAVQQIEKGDAGKLDDLEEEIKFVRQQPIDCIDTINVLDKLIMKAIGTFNIYQICIDDLAVGDKILLDIDDFRNNKISSERLIEKAYAAQKFFIGSSSAFVKPVEKTVNFIIATMTSVLVIVSLLVAIALIFIVMSIKRSEATLRNYADKLKAKTIETEKARQQAEQANKVKSEFLASMSHELRTPLNSMLLLSEELSANYENNFTPDQLEMTNVIYDGGKDLLQLINDILDFSKVESGNMSVNAENIVLDDICQSINTIFLPLAKEKKVDFKINIDTNLPKQFYSDTLRVQQILRNLISNALKFTDKGSVIMKIHRPDSIVSFKNKHLKNNKVIAFSVIDNGIGIPDDKKELIFELFQQADGSTSRKYGGTGLGLSISRKLSTLLGGNIHMESQEGKGSTFILYLPEKYKNIQQ